MQPLIDPSDIITEHLANLRARIEQHGFTMVSVLADPDHGVPGYTYTLGLQEKSGHPDLIIFGVDARDGQLMLNSVVARIRKGPRLVDGEMLEKIANLPLCARVANAACAEFVSTRLSEGRLEYVQIVWPDASGVLPWQPGFDAHLKAAQILLFDQPDDAETPPAGYVLH